MASTQLLSCAIAMHHDVGIKAFESTGVRSIYDVAAWRLQRTTSVLRFLRVR
jgi:hypothetical protein